MTSYKQEVLHTFVDVDVRKQGVKFCEWVLETSIDFLSIFLTNEKHFSLVSHPNKQNF